MAMKLPVITSPLANKALESHCQGPNCLLEIILRNMPNKYYLC
jgi:hypothetical protein